MRACTVVGLVVGLIVTAQVGTLRGALGKETETERIARLIKKLGDDAFEKREAASKELEAIGEPAIGALRKAAASDGDLEIRRRAKRVIQAIAGRVTKRELEKLQGTWSLVSYDVDGKKIKGEDKGHTFTFKGEKWSIHIGGHLFQGGTVQRIEVKEKLNAIDLLIMEGSGVGLTATSIYAIDRGSLKYLNFGAPRATEFRTKPGDGWHYLSLRRAKP